MIFFRDRHLSPAQHVAFARRFGELQVHPFLSANAEHPELVRFEKGADTGGWPARSWMRWRRTPTAGTSRA